VSNYGIGSTRENYTIDSRNEEALEQGKIEKQKEIRIIEKTNERLKQLVPNDVMYEAMENFLLGDPENQIPQLGVPADIIAKWSQQTSQGESITARVEYETAAKVAIYEQDPNLVRNSLELASSVTNPNDRHARMQRTILDNLNDVIRIASEYYRIKQKVTSEEEAAIASVADKK
jgi:hypothetical protein